MPRIAVFIIGVCAIVGCSNNPTAVQAVKPDMADEENFPSLSNSHAKNQLDNSSQGMQKIQLLQPYSDPAKQQSESASSSSPKTTPKITEGRNKTNQDIRFVEKLINESIAAKQIISGGNSQALALRQQALNFLESAKQANETGNQSAADEALHSAKITMMKAMQLSGSGVVREKKQHDFEERFASVKALLEAHKRISKEKNIGKTAEDTEAYVEKTMAESRHNYAAGNLDQSRDLIDKAYLTVKLSLTKLRNGDTLVTSLNFASKEEEYQYELDRNNTHKMLVNMLLREKLSNPRFARLIEKNMSQAEQLRQKAEQQAKIGKYESAIKTLEQSTGQIIRAIRAAGIYIPG